MSHPDTNELHAYADGRLPRARALEVEAYLAEHPEARRQVEAWRELNGQLQDLFTPVLDEPVPDRLRQSGRARRALPWGQIAAGIAMLAIGGTAGWQWRDSQTESSDWVATLPQQAAIAHVVYSPEVLHPVEVGAEQEQHLVMWLSKRLGGQVNAPHLAEQGFNLIGGRLLPGSEGPAAMFMYEDALGKRLSLYVRSQVGGNESTAFRYALEDGVSVFYWIDGPFGYALSGDLDRAQLLATAEAVYHQLNLR